MTSDEKEEEEIKSFMEMAAGLVDHKQFMDNLIIAGFTENQAMKFMAYVIWVSMTEAAADDNEG